MNEIIDEVVKFIRLNPKTTDATVRQFIKQQYKKHHLKTDNKLKSIVAFGSDTSYVHYFADKPRQLKPGDLILVDIWAKLAENGAPFADITWMMYYGRKLPREYAAAFRTVVQARDKAVEYLQNNLKKKIRPLGKEIDAVVRKHLEKYGHGDKFLHGTGHSLGFVSAHGRLTRINRRGRQPLPLNVGYTIEPGVYFKNSPPHLICKNKNFSKRVNLNIKCGGEFGVRSEIDFYVNENYKLIITTKLQKDIIKI